MAASFGVVPVRLHGTWYTRFQSFSIRGFDSFFDFKAKHGANSLSFAAIVYKTQKITLHALRTNNNAACRQSTLIGEFARDDRLNLCRVWVTRTLWRGVMDASRMVFGQTSYVSLPLHVISRHQVRVDIYLLTF